MKQKKQYQVFIKFEHGDADSTSKSSIDFDTESEMRSFLEFIFEVRNFVPADRKQVLNGKLWPSRGHFVDGHNERLIEWVEEIANKHNPDFINFMEFDNRFNQYYAAIDKIFLKINGKKKYIVWTKAIEKDLIELPKIGSFLETNTGQVCGHGSDVFGGDISEYLYHWDLKKIFNEIDGVYTKIKGEVLDIKINKGRLKYNNDFTEFEYEILLQIPEGKVVTHVEGYDPSFSPKCDALPLYEV